MMGGLYLLLGVATLAGAAVLAVWCYVDHRRTHRQLHAMLDSAIAGGFCEKNFNESELAAVESKLYRYLCVQQRTTERSVQERADVATLIADISHQTKTPIANIMLYTQLLGEQPLDDELRPLVEALSAQSQKLSFLVGAMVKSSRLEHGIITVNPRTASVQQLFEAVTTQTAPTATAAGLSLQVLPTYTYACFDPKWTAEVVCNLIDNAIKYTPCGGKVTVSAMTYEMFVRIDVADNGIGINETEHARIFGRFYRSSQVEQQEGVGLGLYLAREIVTMQGGYIKVDSTLGAGSTFSVFLPCPK